MNDSNVIELRDRERVRDNLVREPSGWDQLKSVAGELARKVLGPPHDAERSAVCCQCRKSGDKGELDLIGVYVHPRCSVKVERRTREPLNVYEDLTAFLSVVLIAAIAIAYVVVPIGRALVGE